MIFLNFDIPKARQIWRGLQRTKEMILNGETMFNNAIVNEATGERGLVINPHFIETSNN
jgi:hypothetical protein